MTLPQNIDSIGKTIGESISGFLKDGIDESTPVRMVKSQFSAGASEAHYYYAVKPKLKNNLETMGETGFEVAAGQAVIRWNAKKGNLIREIDKGTVDDTIVNVEEINISVSHNRKDIMIEVVAYFPPTSSVSPKTIALAYIVSKMATAYSSQIKLSTPLLHTEKDAVQEDLKDHPESYVESFNKVINSIGHRFKKVQIGAWSVSLDDIKTGNSMVLTMTINGYTPITDEVIKTIKDRVKMILHDVLIQEYKKSTIARWMLPPGYPKIFV